MSKFRVGQHVVIGTHTPHYTAFLGARERGATILGLGVLILRISPWTTEKGETRTDYDVQAHPMLADARVGGLMQVLREEDLTVDLRSKFHRGRRVQVVAKAPSHSAWADCDVTGREGVVTYGPSERPQSEHYPSGFVVTVELDGDTYPQIVNPEDLEPLEN